MSFVCAGGIEQVLCCGKQQLFFERSNNSYSGGAFAPIYIPVHGEKRREKCKGEKRKKERVRREEQEGGRQDPEDKIGGGAR